MTDKKTKEGKEPGLELQKFYLRDVSFEAPGVPQVFQKKWDTNLNLELNTSHRKISDNIYEVSLKLSAKVELQDETAFLVEVDQAGVFNIINFEAQQLNHMLNSYCPNILFPYAREVITDLTMKGGFPPLILAPINFDGLYMQKLEEAQAKEQDTPVTNGETPKH